MENEFKKVMSERTDEQLIKIITVERQKYQPLAIEAAQLEIEKRNLEPHQFLEIKERAEIEEQKKQNVDSNAVNSSVRFLHYIIDMVAAYFVAMLVFFLVELIFPYTNDFLFSVVTLILVFASFFAYYVIMEIKFQKTVGKFITKTKVVKLNGEKPLESDIVLRTFCRMIPFDQISYLFMKNGFHDTLSKTKVVKDSVV